MFDAFDPSSIYELLGRPITLLPSTGGEATVIASISPSDTIAFDQAAVTTHTFRFRGEVKLAVGDVLVDGNDTYKVASLPRRLNDAEFSADLVRRVV